MRVAVPVILAAFSYASAQPEPVPKCLADCLRNVTNPCDGNSLGSFISCITQRCLDAASAMNITFTPKAEYSCQESLVPGSQDSSKPMTVSGDSSCVSSPYDFKSFITSAGSSAPVFTLSQTCTFDLFPVSGCLGNPESIDINSVNDGTCAFHGGRSARLSCREPIDPSFNPYQYLEQMCANSTSPTSYGTSLTPYATSMAANSTVHVPSITTTFNAAPTPYASDAANHIKESPSTGAAVESTMKSSIAALVVVAAAAIVMI